MTTGEAVPGTVPAITDGSILPSVDTASRRSIRFSSAGVQVAAHFYLPPSHTSGDRWPAVAMAGPMTSVKEETLPHYAVALAQAGIAALAFDPRNFGESDGEPRQHLDTALQIEDLKNAVSFLATLPEVDTDRIGLACVCLGAGFGLEVAAMDRRVKAVALSAGGYNITDSYVEFLGTAAFADYVDMLNSARQASYESGIPQMLPAVAGPPDYAPASMPIREAYEYYTRASATQAPTWQNTLTVTSMEHIVGWNVLSRARLVHQPLMVVHGTTDPILSPRYAQQVYDDSPSETKQLVWIETHNHVELYDQEPYVPQALEAIVPFLAEHLACNGASQRRADHDGQA